MSLDLRSSKLLDLVDSEAQVEQIGTGCLFTEGPIWNAEGNFLLFSDIPADQIKMWTPDSGITTFRQPSGQSNGLTYDKQKRLLACEHANRRVSRTELDGTVTTLVSHYEGKKLNSPNDIVVKSDGSIYFTDPPYGLKAEYGEEGGAELDFQGVYRLSADGQQLTLLVDDFERPNGLCFSPDESILYIDDTTRMHVRAFDVQADGTITKDRVFAVEKGEHGAPDGMKVDQQGNVYLTGPQGIWIFDPEARHLGVIQVPEGAANLGWGGENWQTLFITARSSIYQIQLKVSGIPVP
ncbi:gluconolactonase [Candidatus Poribacteria bacterium]|nr:gluconolactonase [Candidatus Poribacteria bacterium]